MKIALFVVWIIALLFEVNSVLKVYLMADLVAISCVVFFVFILYHETRRHQRKIPVQQNPQDEVGRFTEEEKSIKKTVFIVGFVFSVFSLWVCTA
ncbi:hypothetical protein pdam_00005540 [Pocillopora damicornis]|uniref:Uncharacterized protein n=1 Tax=Pocillopora damicornis TaxID=46731 RepID=A0A3M6TJZ6_POCDA|nr:hypothetical protein pdam_00005540 [Pocillopora damicornis]